MKTTFRKGELNAFLSRAERTRPWPDDVCITADGRCLDTPEKLVAWLDELKAVRQHEPAV